VFCPRCGLKLPETGDCPACGQPRPILDGPQRSVANPDTGPSGALGCGLGGVALGILVGIGVGILICMGILSNFLGGFREIFGGK
jgi:hypothetical protein